MTVVVSRKETELKIYLASSWRNPHQGEVLAQLRASGHEVYDFRNPALDNTGFHWSNVDPQLREDLTPQRLRRALAHPIAQQGFGYDVGAMRWAEGCVLLLPCGLSAHLEAGWMAGAGKPVVVLAPEIREPELMYKLFDMSIDGTNFTPICESVTELLAHLSIIDPPHSP